MYELVNTSVPNGLIAGTHGFATVAMTKGVSDVLRGRIESLCAYTHRTSDHDASYYQQNPVNWFHVVLPQGEHVVGRVAPSDFDYTGRTNRLAKIRVFGANEMPIVGGAEVLIKEKIWFAQSWQGDPRYLDEDKNTCGHLQVLDPMGFSSAPAWDALFGGNGSRYARQIAWQVEKNLAVGGKTVYFKTSPAWDVSGERLLGLFADIINLMPVEARSRVTFSTYPVSMPGGTGCLLRGVYDRDRFFDASSAIQCWVDCENRKVVHAELLPTSGSSSNAPSKREPDEKDVVSGSSERPQGTSASAIIGISRGPTTGGDPNSYRHFLPQQKKGANLIVVGSVALVLIIMLGFVGYCGWLIYEARQSEERRQKEMKKSNIDQGIKGLGPDKECIAKEKFDAEHKEAIELAAKESAAKLNAERKAKAEKEADAKANELRKRKLEKDSQAAADMAVEMAKKENDARRRQNVAYLDAKEFRRGCPSYDYNSLTKKCKDPFIAADGCCVYYYSGNVVTNEPAGFKVNKNIPNSAPLRWGAGLGKKPDDIPLVRNGFVLWYNPSLKRVYIDLNRRKAQNDDGEPWFAHSSSVDLAQMFFGPDPHFKELWEKYTGKKTRYLIDWKFNDNCRSAKSIPTEKAVLTDVEMIAEMRKRAVKDFEETIAEAKLRETKLQKDLDGKLVLGLEKLQGATNAMWSVWRAYQDEEKKITTLREKVKGIDESKPNGWKKEKDRVEKAIQECREKQTKILAEGSDKPTGKPIKGMKVYANITDLKSKIDSKTAAVEGMQKKVNEQRARIVKAKNDIQDAIRSKEELLDKFKDNIGKVLFTVRVKGEVIEE